MNPEQLQKWQEVIDSLCAYLNLDKEQVFKETKEHIAYLQQGIKDGKGAYVVGDLYSQSMYHLFLEVEKRVNRRIQLLASKQEIFLFDIWSMIIDYETISTSQLSFIMPLLKNICDNWFSYISMGSDNSVLSMPCRNIYKALST